MALAGLLTTIGTTLVTALGYVLYIGYQKRSKINELRKQGIPMPKEWSWITGHLLILQRYVDRLPPDAFVNLAMRNLAREYADTEIFLMDFWPVYPPLLMVFNPEAAIQVTTKYNLSKTDMHFKMMKPITGGPNLISMRDEEWKTWRTLFNPGFSAGSIMDQASEVVDSVQVFCDKLRERAGGDLFRLDDFTTRLTMDVIIKVTLDTDLNYQRSENVLSHALSQITAWHSFWDPRILMHPLRPFIQEYYGHVMNKYIRNELEERFTELRSQQLSSSSKKSKRAKSVITLALESYIAENQDKNIMQSAKIDDHFAKYATYQIRLFLFAGNDTTSSSLVYVYHLLFKNPKALARIREEHDTVFGTDVNKATELLRENPALLNQCPYTLAVIKETLRLYTPASTMRQGRQGVSINDKNGRPYPMDNIGATILHTMVHMNPRVWPRAEQFLPERWLVEPGHELYPHNGAWRPFEQGPRNCIGQTLVYNEMRIVLVMTARMFDIRPAYDEWDAMHEREAGLLERLVKWSGLGSEKIKTVDGERAYQTDKGGAHPAEGYPCRVTLANR